MSQLGVFLARQELRVVFDNFDANKDGKVTSEERKAVKIGPRPWIAPLMVSLFLFGLVWIVIFYITRGDLPLMSELGNWNLLVGFAFIAAGFVVSTKWR